ncbi:Uncharacterised protein [Mycobacteroides abscessus]|nr:Uncharacterised protein [Mycobacteroides abscessus]
MTSRPSCDPPHTAGSSRLGTPVVVKGSVHASSA